MLSFICKAFVSVYKIEQLNVRVLENDHLESFATNFTFYSVFQGISKAKFANGGSILSSSQFSILL
jgi:hypothetical protein